MTLRPKEIVFEEVWGSLRDTVEKVLKLNKVEKTKWSESFL